MESGGARECWDNLGVSQEWFSWMMPIITPTPKSILNIGCQDGKEALALSLLFSPNEIVVCDKDLEGKLLLEKEFSDLSSKSKPCWNERPTIKFFQWDVTTEVPFNQPRTFDTIYCDNVLYYIYADQGEYGLAEVIRKLNHLTGPQGFVVMTEPKIGKHLVPEQEEKSAEMDSENSWLDPFIPKVIVSGQTLNITPILEESEFSVIHYDAENARYVGKKN